MSLMKRTSTAAVLLTLVLIMVQVFSRLGFFLALQFLVLVSLFEFFNLSRKRNLFPNKVLGILLALIIAASFYFDAFPLGAAFFACLLFIAVYYVLTVTKLEKLPGFQSSVALTFFGAFYLSFTLNHFNLLKEEWGSYYIYFLLTLIFMGDTGAYFIGKLIGRHKLAPVASPKKTWEGSFAGIIFACAGAVVVQQLLLDDVVLWKAVVFAAVIHPFAQISDALESLFKRAVGVKDSSNILPGHGGFLDRVDSLILAAPLFYYLLRFIGMD
jgi:phosphatidate cytidylyltransferase